MANTNTKLLKTDEKDNVANNSTVVKNTNTKLKGVDTATTDKINSSFSASSDQTAAQSKANSALSNLESVSSKNNVVSSSIWDTLNAKFRVPAAVTEADSYLKAQLNKIQSGKTSYTDQVKDMMSQIQNREKFSYDVDADPLFQQALSSAMNSGKSAMQDTIGQASALTGGYGSTYATTAGNQAYNAFIEDAYNNLPQYYQMALEAYQMEGDEMYRQLGMLNEADVTEYNRNLNAYDATYQHRNRVYDEAYTQFRDSKTDALNYANLQLSEHGQIVNDAFNLYSATSNHADTLYAREFEKWNAEVNQAMQYAGMLNTDYWNQTNFDEGVRQYEKSFAEDVRQYDKSFAENQRQFNENLAENKRQFNTQMAYSKSKSSSGSGSRSGYTTRGGVEYKTPTETQKKNALKAYNEGGETEYYKYLDSLPSNVDVVEIDEYVLGDGSSENKGYGELPYSQRTYTVIDDGGVNWGFGVDNNAKVQDQYGHEYTLKELKEYDEDIALELSNKKYTKNSTYKKQ